MVTRSTPARKFQPRPPPKLVDGGPSGTSLGASMQDWSIPLASATAAFLALVVWRVRPALPWGQGRHARREALRAASALIEAAPSDHARALALCDAADVVGKG